MNRFFSNTAGLLFFVFLLSCNGKKRKASILTGYMSSYSNEAREKKYLKEELQEISGIFFLNEGQKIAAVNDEEGKVFVLDFANKDTTTSFVFALKGDFEDIVADKNYYYILESKGKIYRVPKTGVQDTVTHFKLDIKDADFEAMYMDTAMKKIVLVCKSCREYEKNKLIPAYCFDLATNTFEAEPCFTIDVKKVRKLLKSNGFGSKASAAAINPKNNKLYIVCSQEGKGLLICDLEGNVEQAIYLDDEVFPQPEGITFAPNGDMYISNEGLYQPGSIIFYPYKKK